MSIFTHSSSVPSKLPLFPFSSSFFETNELVSSQNCGGKETFSVERILAVCSCNCERRGFGTAFDSTDNVGGGAL